MRRRTLLGWLGLGGATAATGGGLMATRARAANPYYSGPPSDHFDGRVFFNPEGVPPASFGDLMRWQFGGGRTRWPDAWPSPFMSAKPEASVGGTGLRVTMVGHATQLIQVAGLNILTDPVWSARVSPVSFAGPRRVNDPGIAFADLPPVDLVLVSHNHYDHMDLPTLERLRRAYNPLVVTPLGNDTIIRSRVPDMRVVAHDWGDTVDAGRGVRVHLEPTHHWSARGTADRRMALWCAFCLETPAGSIYLAGDTGFHDGRNYAAARRKHGPFRYAAIPIGAYEPRWFMAPQHQNPEEAVEAFRLLGSGHAGGIHWGTFPLTNEGVEEPRDMLHASLDRGGVSRERFRAMLPGEVWDIPA